MCCFEKFSVSLCRAQAVEHRKHRLHGDILLLPQLSSFTHSWRLINLGFSRIALVVFKYLRPQGS